MNFTLLATYSLSVVILPLTPDPVVALTTTATSQHGYRQAFIMLIGTNGASLVLIALTALMPAGMVSVSVIWLGVLSLVGLLYIGVVAINDLRARNSNPGLYAPKHDNSELIHGFPTGVANPEDILFFVAFFPQFIAIMQDLTTSIVTPMLVWVISDVTVLSSYVMVFERWTSERFARRSVSISSLFLLMVVAFGTIYNVYALQVLSPAM